jgi:hypothetical protein
MHHPAPQGLEPLTPRDDKRRRLAPRSRAALRTMTALAGVWLTSSCAPVTSPARAELSALAAYELALEPDIAWVAPLAWAAPSDPSRPWIYRVSVDEEIPARLLEVARRSAEHSQSLLALGPSSVPKAAMKGDVFVGQLRFTGPVSDHRSLGREWVTSPTLRGPASPDAPCQDRTWDPVEDALALGWPRLPGRLSAVGETWTGARVEGRCNRFACYDPDTGRGGADANTPPCVTMSWTETLVNIGTLGPLRVALIESEWSDGHPTGVGVSSERRALVDIDTGRLLLATISIHHNILGIERTIELAAVDAQDGSLVAAGWRRPEPLAASVDQFRDEFAQQSPSSRREAATTRARKKPNNG